MWVSAEWNVKQIEGEEGKNSNIWTLDEQTDLFKIKIYDSVMKLMNKM